MPSVLRELTTESDSTVTNSMAILPFGWSNPPTAKPFSITVDRAATTLCNTPPLIPASQLLVPITYIGAIAASNPVNWTDPFESETFEFVPPEMGDARGRFACRIESDSMMPLLEPHDVCVFQRTDVPKIGHVILFRSHDRLVTVKQLKHNGVNYLLHPLNPTYDDSPANGQMLGFLVGIVRERGTQRLTVFDSTGILP